MKLFEDIKKSFNKGSSLTKLIYINIGVFIVMSIMAIIGFLFTTPLIYAKTVDFFCCACIFAKFIAKALDADYIYVFA